jgi:hypothetical protein
MDYKKEDILRLYNKYKLRKNKTEDTTKKQQKWISFTYIGHYIRKVTKLFKDTNIKIAYRTTSITGKLLNEKQKMNPYEQSGIYKLACQSCHKAYIGQTGINLTTRYNEHIRNIRFNKHELVFAQHILNKQHQYSPMTTIMEMVEPAKKGNLMNIKENFHIYHLNKNNKLIEEQKSNKESHNQNEMFDIIININTHPQIRHNTQEV